MTITSIRQYSVAVTISVMVLTSECRSCEHGSYECFWTQRVSIFLGSGAHIVVTGVLDLTREIAGGRTTALTTVSS